MEDTKKEYAIIMDGGTEIKEGITEEEIDKIMEMSERWHGNWSMERKDKITQALIASPESAATWDENEVLAVKVDGVWWEWL